jgi:glycosyltransferase involved in cell wall biosynthesis
MASGVPVVASDVGGLPEVVESGVTGFLSPVGDVEAMAGACLRILSEPGTLRKFAEAAQRRAAQCFDYRRIIPQYESIYEELVAVS